MFQVYCATSLSSGMSRNSASRIVPVTARVQPIHSPPARKLNRTTNIVTTTISMTKQAAWGAEAFGSGYSATPPARMLRSSSGRPKAACRKRAANWMVSRMMPKVMKAWGIQTRVPLETDVWPASKLRQVK